MELTVFLELSNSFSVLKLSRRYACRFVIDVSSTASVKIRTASFARHKYRNRRQTTRWFLTTQSEGSMREALRKKWYFLVRTPRFLHPQDINALRTHLFRKRTASHTYTPFSFFYITKLKMYSNQQRKKIRVIFQSLEKMLDSLLLWPNYSPSAPEPQRRYGLQDSFLSIPCLQRFIERQRVQCKASLDFFISRFIAQ